MEDQNNTGGFNPHFSFFKNIYEPKPVEVTNLPAFAANMSALTNPTETLRAEQLAKVAELTANIKLDGLRPDLIGGVLKQKQDFEDWYMDALKNNSDGTPKTGLSRLKLSDDQKIEARKRQDELGRSAGYIKYVGESLKAAEAKALQKGMEGKDYNDWYNGFVDKVKAASKSGKPEDYPDANVDLGNFLEKQPYSTLDVNKLEKDAFAPGKVFEKTATDIGGGKTQIIDQANPNIIRYQAEDLAKTDPKFKRWIDANYGTKDNPDGMEGYTQAKLREFGRINKNIKSQWTQAQYIPGALGTATLEGTPLQDGSGKRIQLGDHAQSVSGTGYVVGDDDSIDKNDKVVIPAGTQASNLIVDANKTPQYWETTIKRKVPEYLSDGKTKNPKYKQAQKAFDNGDKTAMEETVVVRTPAGEDAKQILGQKKVFLKQGSNSNAPKNTKQSHKDNPFQ
jgi:hypothetical protein